MKERPILFSAPMVRAILEGRKTMTRRAINMDRLCVNVPRLVRADVHGYGYAKQGRHKATMNPLGAVSCFLPNGKQLGLKPGEFKFECPFADGEIFITDGKWEILGNGSRLWVKETFRAHELVDGTDGIEYRADDSFERIENTKEAADRWVDARRGEKWRPSIFMPRWASRITLEVTEVRVERLREITEEDAKAEGVSLNSTTHWATEARDAFHCLWESINGKESWDANPWVWVISFKHI